MMTTYDGERESNVDGLCIQNVGDLGRGSLLLKLASRVHVPSHADNVVAFVKQLFN